MSSREALSVADNELEGVLDSEVVLVSTADSDCEIVVDEVPDLCDLVSFGVFPVSDSVVLLLCC